MDTPEGCRYHLATRMPGDERWGPTRWSYSMGAGLQGAGNPPRLPARMVAGGGDAVGVNRIGGTSVLGSSASLRTQRPLSTPRGRRVRTALPSPRAARMDAMTKQATMERVQTPRSPARRRPDATALLGLTDTDRTMLRTTALPPVRPFQGTAISEWTRVSDYGVNNRAGKVTRRTWGGDPWSPRKIAEQASIDSLHFGDNSSLPPPMRMLPD